MWNQFSNLGIYELNVIDTTTHSIKDTVSAVKEKNSKRYGFTILDNFQFIGGMKVGEPSADGGAKPYPLGEPRVFDGEAVKTHKGLLLTRVTELRILKVKQFILK